MKRKRWCWIAFLLLLTGSVGTVKGEPFLEDAYWDSGKAEFQVYEASLQKYGMPRNATVKLILVKEPFDPDALVKTSLSAGSVNVIKMNYIRQIPTGIYDYFQMASIFFERSTGSVLKYTMSSQDGCGNTFMEYLRHDGNHLFRYHSYFDDQGDTKIVLRDTEFVFYDALPLALRCRLSEEKAYRLNIMDSLISNKAVPLTIREATVRNRIEEKRNVGGRTYPRVFVSEVARDEKKDVFVFEFDYPHRLLEWKQSNGDAMRINQSHFLYYWEHVKPGDRPLGTLQDRQ